MDRLERMTSKIFIAPELEEVQPLMKIEQDDFERLKSSIKKDGRIRDPLKVYVDSEQKYWLLSGWNRLNIAKELGFATVPIEIVKLESKQARKDFAISENFDRRQLSREQKAAYVEYLLKQKPDQSNRTIAVEAKVDHKTVSAKRTELETTGEIPQLKGTVGKDGKMRTTAPKKSTPSKPTPKPKPTITAPTKTKPSTARQDAYKTILKALEGNKKAIGLLEKYWNK